MDDELFMADSSPSRQENISNTSAIYPQPGNLFYTSQMKSKVLAFHMLKSLMKRISYKYSNRLRLRQTKSLLKWRFSPVIPAPFSNSEHILHAMFANFSMGIKNILKKKFSKWACTYRLHLVMNKRTYNKTRREEAHLSQIGQMNKALTQILNKQAEVEKAISHIVSREKQYKDTIEDLTKTPLLENSDLQRYELVLKELENENQKLRDKLEAVENNVSGFIKEMGNLLENEEVSTPSDDDGLGDSQGRSTRKKKSSIR